MAETMAKKRKDDLPGLGEGEEYEAQEPKHSPEVLAWRREQFIALGYSVKWADFLSESNLDLGRVRTLLLAGCSRRHAVQLLAGLGPTGHDDPQFNWATYETLRKGRKAAA